MPRIEFRSKRGGRSFEPSYFEKSAVSKANAELKLIPHLDMRKLSFYFIPRAALYSLKLTSSGTERPK